MLDEYPDPTEPNKSNLLILFLFFGWIQNTLLLFS
jgi:hypothetical protein